MTDRVEMPPTSRALSRKAAIIGIGETDFRADYLAARTKAPGYAPPTLDGLLTTAFERALADAGLRREAIDGLSVSFTYGGPSPAAVAETLGVRPRRLIDNFGIMAGPLPAVCAAIAEGSCDTVAMVYAVSPRTQGRVFGGRAYEEGSVPSSYYYHHPWGWSSQAAHWALVCQYYQNSFGTSEADLGRVAVQVRENALKNPNAIMQAPLTVEEYLTSRYIVRPLHLFDICLANDGGVCLIVTRAERAKDAPHPSVLVAGWGQAKVKTDKLHHLVRERLRPQMQEAGRQAFGMAGIEPSDIGHFEAYDASTIHLISQLEGFGFAAPGEGLAFCAAGQMAVGGAMPTNVAGGMLSGAYMHGWSHVAEMVRQLRGEAGPRQIAGLDASLFSLAETDQVHPLILTRGA